MIFDLIKTLKSYLRVTFYTDSGYLLGKYLFLFHNTGSKMAGASAICQLSS